MGDSDKGFAKAKVNNIDCSPLIHKARHLITAGSQVAQLQFSLYKSTRTAPQPLSCPSCVWKCFPGGFCPTPSRDGGADVWSVVPRIFLLALLEERRDICPFPAFANLYQLP